MVAQSKLVESSTITRIDSPIQFTWTCPTRARLHLTIFSRHPTTNLNRLAVDLPTVADQHERRNRNLARLSQTIEGDLGRNSLELLLSLACEKDSVMVYQER